MTTDRIICKQCGNTESPNLEIIDDGKYVFCKICKAITPLYDKYERLTVDGIIDKGQRLKSAKHLLFLKRYADAIDVYRKLTQDYSDSFEAWYGYAEALSQGFYTTDLTGDTKNALSAASSAADNAQQKSLLEDAVSRLEENNKKKLHRAQIEKDIELHRAQIEEDIKILKQQKGTAVNKRKSLSLQLQIQKERLTEVEQLNDRQIRGNEKLTYTFGQDIAHLRTAIQFMNAEIDELSSLIQDIEGSIARKQTDLSSQFDIK